MDSPEKEIVIVMSKSNLTLLESCEFSTSVNACEQAQQLPDRQTNNMCFALLEFLVVPEDFLEVPFDEFPESAYCNNIEPTGRFKVIPCLQQNYA